VDLAAYLRYVKEMFEVFEGITGLVVGVAERFKARPCTPFIRMKRAYLYRVTTENVYVNPIADLGRKAKKWRLGFVAHRCPTDLNPS
jgi:hypothetical protein